MDARKFLINLLYRATAQSSEVPGWSHRQTKNLNVPRLTVRTVEKHLDRLRVFFNSLVQRGELARNPLSDLRLQTQAAKYEPKRRGFTPKELMVLFEPERRAEHASDDPMKFWLPVLMLYTGARLNELVYLDAQDFDCIDGVWRFHITKHLKTLQSKRYLPLPQRVVDLGLREYAQDIRAAASSTCSQEARRKRRTAAAIPSANGLTAHSCARRAASPIPRCASKVSASR